MNPHGRLRNGILQYLYSAYICRPKPQKADLCWSLGQMMLRFYLWMKKEDVVRDIF